MINNIMVILLVCVGFFVNHVTADDHDISATITNSPPRAYTSFRELDISGAGAAEFYKQTLSDGDLVAEAPFETNNCPPVEHDKNSQIISSGALYQTKEHEIRLSHFQPSLQKTPTAPTSKYSPFCIISTLCGPMLCIGVLLSVLAAKHFGYIL